MKVFYVLCAFATIASNAFAQFVVSGDGVMTAANQPLVSVNTSGLVKNETTYRFDNTRFILDLKGSDQTIEGDWTVFQLKLSDGASKALKGNMHVTDGLVFENGTLEVMDGSSLLYTGFWENITEDQNRLSYIIGPMKQIGGGEKLYPIGTSTRYAEIKFFDIDEVLEEITVQAFDGTAMSTNDPSLRILPGYWNVDISDAAKLNSLVRVPLLELISSEEEAVVLQEENGIALNLGSIPGAVETQITSVSPVTSKIIGVGATTEIDITIHELITPYGSPGVFDQLEIHNLAGFAYNKVTMLDRYGVQLKEWENYRNDEQQDFFKTLSPGNYICIVEYGAEQGNVRKKSQMVTVLKSR